jgi:hypothetical protein
MVRHARKRITKPAARCAPESDDARVAAPVGSFCQAYFGTELVDVDMPADCAGADVVVLGRQQLRPEGQRLGADLVEPLLAVVEPRLLIATLPDVYADIRYARDLAAWQALCARGVATVVLEVRTLRALRESGTSPEELVTIARTHEATARRVLKPVSWLSGAVLQ